LTGFPNQIFDTNFYVVAPALTEKTVHTGGGNLLKYYERTGGLKDGLVIVKCAPSPGNENERTTKCYSIPTLLIYAKDRYTDEPFQHK
jgi:hypothetical protein